MPTILYVSLQREDRVLVYQLDPEVADLHLRSTVVLPGGPAPIAVSPDKTRMYIGLRGSQQIAALEIDPQTGDLTLRGLVSLDSDPCYLSTDRQGNYLFSAYYRAGKIKVHAIGADGNLSPQALQDIPTAERAHCIQADPSNRFVLVPHTAGPNLIFQFIFSADTGQLTPNPVPRLVPPEGEGPRHYCYHPHLPLVYFSNEQGSSVTVYELDTSNGTLKPRQTLSTLPPDYTGPNDCAQIHLTPSGRFLYVSNRGHDSIAMFAADPDTGMLAAIGHQPTEPTPRAFNIDPKGKFVFVGGLASGRMASYRIEPSEGTLTALHVGKVGMQPMWIEMVDFGKV